MASTIQNSETLACSHMRRDALAIAEAGYAAIDVGTALKRRFRFEGEQLHIDTETYQLADRRAYFIGIGKCAFAGARAIEELLGEKLTGGIALDVSPLDGPPLTKIETHTGTHPLPSEANVEATKRIMAFLSGREESDFVIMLISGGGSALLCLPSAPMTCLDESVLFSELTAQGASIQEMNTVRKHISLARGGALARAAYPAEIVSLIISDVPGNDIAYIASGPTVRDTSTVEDARAVLTKYAVTATAVAFIETPKEQIYFDRVTNILFLSNQDALSAMKIEAENRGYAAEIADDRFNGEAREVGRMIIEKLHAAPAQTALFYAGESTVTLPVEHGAGGRNQELALAALLDIRAGELVLPFASDGRDNTDHAGAIADEMTRAHASEKNLSIQESLDMHHSYDFFTASGDALVTGYTGSNVSDLIIALKK